MVPLCLEVELEELFIEDVEEALIRDAWDPLFSPLSRLSSSSEDFRFSGEPLDPEPLEREEPLGTSGVSSSLEESRARRFKP